MSWHVIPLRLCLAVMAAPKNRPKIVFRSAGVTRIGRKNIVAWTEYSLRALLASCKLETLGKPSRTRNTMSFCFLACLASLTIPCRVVCAVGRVSSLHVLSSACLLFDFSWPVCTGYRTWCLWSGYACTSKIRSQIHKTTSEAHACPKPFQKFAPGLRIASDVMHLYMYFLNSFVEAFWLTPLSYAPNLIFATLTLWAKSRAIPACASPQEFLDLRVCWPNKICANRTVTISHVFAEHFSDGKKQLSCKEFHRKLKRSRKSFPRKCIMRMMTLPTRWKIG